MSGHTPGPWVVFILETASSVMPAMRPGDICNLDGCMSPDERNANARLIAASPDLLAACIDLLQHASLTEHMSASSVERARAAVAKAGAA